MNREEWKAQKSKPVPEFEKTKPLSYVIIHQGELKKYCSNIIECIKVVKYYQAVHMNKENKSDIGYNFIIDGDGNLYEGRGWDHVGEHTSGYNHQSLGINVIGDYPGWFLFTIN